MSRQALSINELVDVYALLAAHAKQQQAVRNPQQIATGVANAVLGALTHIGHMVHNRTPVAGAGRTQQQQVEAQFYQAVINARNHLNGYQRLMNTTYRHPTTKEEYDELMSLIHYAIGQGPTAPLNQLLAFLLSKHWTQPKIIAHAAWHP